MELCCTTFEKIPAPAKGSVVILPFALPRRSRVVRRARWIVSPHPTDDGSYTPEGGIPRWMGAAKAFFWLAAAIASGLLIAGLCG